MQHQQITSNLIGSKSRFACQDANDSEPYIITFYQILAVTNNSNLLAATNEYNLYSKRTKIDLAYLNNKKSSTTLVIIADEPFAR